MTLALSSQTTLAGPLRDRIFVYRNQQTASKFDNKAAALPGEIQIMHDTRRKKFTEAVEVFLAT